MKNGAALGQTGGQFGYGVVDHGGTGMMEIQRIDEMGIFESDDEAVAQAIRDGIKIIPIEELPKEFDRRYLGWIDTPGNRAAIQAYTDIHTKRDATMRYLNEASLRLTRAGFTTEKNEEYSFLVKFNGEPLCTVTGKDVRYNSKDMEGGDWHEALDKVLSITHTVGEYMRLMNTSPELKATGLHDGFKLLAEFNGTVLAGRKYDSMPGHQFVTWSRTYDGTGVTQGNYIEDYETAKQDFATRSGLVQKGRQFSDEQLAEVYRCIHETLDSGYPITPEREKLLRETAEQIDMAVPELEQRVQHSNHLELEYAERYGQAPELW